MLNIQKSVKFVLLLAGLTFVPMPAMAQKNQNPQPSTPTPTSSVDFPKNYRKWKHISTKAIKDKSHKLYTVHGPMFHIYGNKKATKALRKEKKFKNGSVLVLDSFETLEEGGILQRGLRKTIAVMEYHKKKYAKTGGWGFQNFKGPAHTPQLNSSKLQYQCFACHQKQKEKQSVHSLWQL